MSYKWCAIRLNVCGPTVFFGYCIELSLAKRNTLTEKKIKDYNVPYKKGAVWNRRRVDLEGIQDQTKLTDATGIEETVDE